MKGGAVVPPFSMGLNL